MQYLVLREFSIVPDWSVLSDDGTVLLLPAYRAEEGWVWDFPEDARERQRYIEAVIREVRTLEGATFSEEIIARYNLQPYLRDEMALDEGFEKLLTDSAVRQVLMEKIKTIQDDRHTEKVRVFMDILADTSALEQLSVVAKRLIVQPNTVFGHCDVRSDNIAFNTQTGEVKLVDWNWASFTPIHFGSTEFLADAARRGIDVVPWHGYLNRELLASLVGVWGYSCTHPPLVPGGTLRDVQALLAALTYDMYTTLSG